MVEIILNEDEFDKYYKALDARASEISENTEELQVLFTLRQEFGPTPESNTGAEMLSVEFDEVSTDEAIRILRENDNPTLQELGKTLDIGR